MQILQDHYEKLKYYMKTFEQNIINLYAEKGRQWLKYLPQPYYTASDYLWVIKFKTRK